MLFIKPTFLNCYFKILVEPDYDGNDDQFAKYCQTLRNHCFQGVLLLIIRATFWSSYSENGAEHHFGLKYGQFAKHCHRRFFHRFPLVYLCVLCKQQFGVFTEKFLVNEITTLKMASLESIVTRLIIIVLCYSYSTYHQNDTLKDLPRNCHLTPLRPKRFQISKLHSHASESSLLSSYLVLSIIITFWSLHGEILAEPSYCPKDSQFAKHRQTPHNNPS